ncbi:acyl-ACP--UDP-N-acetylglucosamine O-acyltransferase [Flavobacteriaceae bacterium]|nr:acyl-ACP--UDP-N-acetylglucosamine O-acyltransferase [Flavobacteriaceae bacterium]MDC3354327.1 acyl-ACP--UDP-N-acetylglucosamine O-acyltransferase [Flavobacteriaceae bacterium]
MIKSLNHIHPKAKIGKNVTVDPFTMIHEDVEIGENTWIGSNVTIMNGARIGANCKVFPGAVIAAIPQDLKFKGEDSLVVIGDHTVIRECVTINRGTLATGKTQVGSHCLIMAYSHIAHDCLVGNNCIFSNNSTLAGHITIGNNVVIAGFTAIQQFCSVGDFAFISGGSLVRKDIPPFTKVARDPLIFIGVNSIGMERSGVDKDRISRIQKIYRILFKSKHNITQALQIVKEEIEPTEDRKTILQFIEKSTHGIVRGYDQKS